MRPPTAAPLSSRLETVIRPLMRVGVGAAVGAADGVGVGVAVGVGLADPPVIGMLQALNMNPSAVSARGSRRMSTGAWTRARWEITATPRPPLCPAADL